MEFNGTFLVSIITFLVFVFLMNKVLYAPMANIVAERKRIIDNNYQDAEQIEQQTKTLSEETEKKLTKAKEEARVKYVEVLDEYKEKRAEIVKGAQDSSKEELQASYQALDNVSNDAKESLKARMVELANDISEKILGYRSDIQGFDNDKVNEILYR